MSLIQSLKNLKITGIFTNVSMQMPFILDTYSDPEQEELAGLISLEAQKCIEGKIVYFYASFELKEKIMYQNGDYEQMREILRKASGTSVTVILGYKKEKLKTFQRDLKSLADHFQDQRFLQLKCTVYGINHKSCKELSE